MSSTNRRFLIAYISMVALPIVGLLGVLKHGRGLNAPISVDGLWKLELNASQLANLPCGKILAGAAEPSFSISQSGEKFVLNLVNGAKVTASGSIEGKTLSASLQPPDNWTSASGCGSDQSLRLVATVDPNAKPRSLAGTLSVNDCTSCQPVEFRALRETPPAKGAH